MTLIRREAERTGTDSPGGILTLLAVSSQTIAVVGPTLGGLLIGLGGWRTIFSVNIPLSLACLALGALRLPRTRPEDRRRSTVDILGTVLFAGTLTALLLFLMDLRAGHWWLLLLTAAVAAAFAVRELHVADPFLDLRVLGSNGPLMATYGRNADVRRLVRVPVRLHAVAGGRPRAEPVRGRPGAAADVRRGDRGVRADRPPPGRAASWSAAASPSSSPAGCCSRCTRPVRSGCSCWSR
jgi:hypothetical protein